MKADDIIDRLKDEIARQNNRWGEQNHPLIHPDYESAVLIHSWEQVQVAGEDGNIHGGLVKVNAEASYEDFAHALKHSNDRREEIGEQAWDAILLEEVMESFAATTPEDQVEELIQVAAVALQAAASIERNSDG